MEISRSRARKSRRSTKVREGMSRHVSGKRARGLGIRYRQAYPQLYRPEKRAERSPAPPQAPSSGALCFGSALDALVKPVQHFLLDPPDPALAELYPLGERSGRLKAGDMLRAVKNKLLELALRYYSHRITPRQIGREHV